MRRRWLFGLILMTGCAYVTESELLDTLDADGDGWYLDDHRMADCDDENPLIYPGAVDRRGDGCDADCGVEPDLDGDDWPDSSDCDATDPSIHPGVTDDVDGDGVDSDCDGADGPRATPAPTDDPKDPLDTWNEELGGFDGPPVIFDGNPCENG